MSEQGLDRRQFLALGAGVLAVGVIPRGLDARPRLVRRTVPVMGTLGEVAVVDTRPDRARSALDAAVAELRRVEALMTRFRDDSDVGRANLQAGGTGVSVSPETAEVLASALAWARESDGVFDPCLGRAAGLWDPAGRTHPPAPSELDALAGAGLWRALELEASGTGGRVRLHHPGAALDLGGIAKGYGVDLAVRALRERGAEHGLVNVGGDLRVLGRSEDGDPWRVGIRSPEDPDRLVATLEVEDGAVATSGDYLRYFEYGGRRYHHLLDPVSAAPRRSPVRSLTVRASTCMEGDAAATAAFGIPTFRAREILRRRGTGVRVVHTIEGDSGGPGSLEIRGA